MADPIPGDDTGVGPGREYPSIPRWVKVSGIIVIGLVLLVVVVLLVATALGLHTPSGGPGGHGPGRDTPSGDAGSQTSLSSIIEDDTLSGGDLADQTSRSSVTEHGVQQP
jgi:hypothetical protein